MLQFSSGCSYLLERKGKSKKRFNYLFVNYNKHRKHASFYKYIIYYVQYTRCYHARANTLSLSCHLSKCNFVQMLVNRT